MILTKASFDILREELFRGSLTTSQVKALNFLVARCDQAGLTYPETAYALATVFHETDRTMLPIEERGSDKYLSKYDTGKLAKDLGNTPEADGDGQFYKGRGYVQITGKANYAKFAKILNLPLVLEPELALSTEVAAQIMIYGMLNGTFTGVGFRKRRPVVKYGKANYVAARAIINGKDCAELIAGYAMIFEKALRS